jgi:MoaA/NifB/PqqE/SkfB family radical SAM enzyme
VNLARAIDLKRNALTSRLRRVPVVILMPHSRCNCRCVMCDIWKANRNGTSISEEQLNGLIEDFRKLHVEWVVLSGGEPLMHPNLWALCSLLKGLPARITLLSTGLLLPRHAAAIARYCDEVVVSLDGSREVHDRIRAVPNAFDRLANGVATLRASGAGYPILGRCVLQRLNFNDLPNIITAARTIGLDHVSFLAADISSTAFNRPDGWLSDRISEVCLTPDETERFAEILEETLDRHSEAFSSGFVTQSPARMRNIVAYYRAANGQGSFPKVTCNAPWVSTVVEADGTVRPCFFHRALGNIREGSIAEILNSPDAIEFRRQLDVQRDEVCRRCVCTVHMTR